MRVTLCVDSLEPQLTGIGRYTWELCKGLANRDEISRLQFFRSNRLIGDPARLVRGERVARSKWPARLFHQWQARRALGQSLVHAPNYFLPAAADGGVITIHDLSVFRYPDLHPANRVKDFEQNLGRSIARANQLITDCETIRNEVIAFTGIAAERVSAVPLGVSDAYRPMSTSERASVLKRYSLPLNGYGLSVSSFEPRKRIDRLLAAWRQLPARARKRWPLVISGAAGWNNERLHAEISRAAEEGWLIRLGFIPETELPAVYAGAALFLYASAYEGFGLPPLEAMASGVPTVVAASSCLPEVTRGAAMITDPDDIAGFSQDILRGLEDQSWRDGAISAGIQVASGYTWARCVHETVSVYQRVMDG